MDPKLKVNLLLVLVLPRWVTEIALRSYRANHQRQLQSSHVKLTILNTFGDFSSLQLNWVVDSSVSKRNELSQSRQLVLRLQRIVKLTFILRQVLEEAPWILVQHPHGIFVVRNAL